MDAIFINPKDEKELQYVMNLMDSLGIRNVRIDAHAKEEIEQYMENGDEISTEGVIRGEVSHAKLSEQQINMLQNSESEIVQKLIVTEQKIQFEEDKWLHQ